MDEYLDQQMYQESFDPRAYFKSLYCNPTVSTPKLQSNISFYASFPDASLEILEYGGGPSLRDLIAAAPKASKIIFSDYTKQNEEEVQKWINRDPEAFDWTPTIRHVLELEGKGTDTTEVEKREECLRRSIKAVVHCDLAAKPIVEKGYEGPYDVVNCSWVLDSICETKEQYFDGVKKLSTLVKKGGYLILTLGIEYETYDAGEEFETPLNVTVGDIKEAFTASGFSEINCLTYKVDEETVLAYGKKI